MNISRKSPFHLTPKSRLILAGVLLAVIITILGIILNAHGFFIPWKNLGTPLGNPRSGEKVTTILGVSPRSIRIGTNLKRAFEINLAWVAWGDPPDKYLLQWNEVAYDSLQYTPANFDCPFTFWEPPFLAYPYGIIAEAQVKDCRLYIGIAQAHYIIREDGTVWVWEHLRDMNQW